jgi:histidine triad (HIT) family protein
MNKEDCLFCRIASGLEPAEVMWGDKGYVAFLNIYPERSGHLLLIPRKHTDYYWHLSRADFGELMERAHLLTGPLMVASKSEKVYVKLIGEHVAHVHVHLIPKTFEGLAEDTLAEVGKCLRQRMTSI